MRVRNRVGFTVRRNFAVIACLFEASVGATDAVWRTFAARSGRTVLHLWTNRPIVSGNRSPKPIWNMKYGVQWFDPTCVYRLQLRLDSGRLMSDFSMPFDGKCDARFDSVRELFTDKLDSGEDLGASLIVNIDGEMVVDL